MVATAANLRRVLHKVKTLRQTDGPICRRISQHLNNKTKTKMERNDNLREETVLTYLREQDIAFEEYHHSPVTSDVEK